MEYILYLIFGEKGGWGDGEMGGWGDGGTFKGRFFRLSLFFWF